MGNVWGAVDGTSVPVWSSFGARTGRLLRPRENYALRVRSRVRPTTDVFAYARSASARDAVGNAVGFVPTAFVGAVRIEERLDGLWQHVGLRFGSVHPSMRAFNPRLGVPYWPVSAWVRPDFARLADEHAPHSDWQGWKPTLQPTLAIGCGSGALGVALANVVRPSDDVAVTAHAWMNAPHAGTGVSTSLSMRLDEDIAGPHLRNVVIGGEASLTSTAGFAADVGAQYRTADTEIAAVTTRNREAFRLSAWHSRERYHHDPTTVALGVSHERDFYPQPGTLRRSTPRITYSAP